MAISRYAFGSLLLAIGGGALVMVACLNPQPLPPDDGAGSSKGGSSGDPSRAPAFEGDPTAAPPTPGAAQDAGSPTPADASASDAGADADAGG